MNRTELLQIAKPIIFNGEMVRAILDGRKDRTRQVIKTVKYCNGIESDNNYRAICEISGHMHYAKPRYKVGDYLYVRETWATERAGICKSKDGCPEYDPHDLDNPFCGGSCGSRYVYRTNYGSTEDDSFPPSIFRWKPSIHMPKAAARIFLRVTDVRAERVQDITYDDIAAEGCTVDEFKIGWIDLWDSIYTGSGYGWDSNPFVWVYVFERVEAE